MTEPMTEPMTDETLAKWCDTPLDMWTHEALRAEVERLRTIDEQQHGWIGQLMDEQTRYASENARLKATLRDFARRVMDVNNMSEWNLAGRADTARAILGEV